MADMIKDAMAAADNHLKVAHDNLIKAQAWLDIIGAGHNPVPRPLPKTQVFGLTGVWICLALFISLIVLAQFLRRRNFNVASGSLISKCQHKMNDCLRYAYAKQPQEPQQPVPQEPQQPQEPEQPVPPQPLNKFTKEDMTTAIKNSIKKLLSSKESLKLTNLDKINENEVEDVKDAIKTVRSIEEYLTMLESQKDNYGEHEKKIQDALKPAIDAAQLIEKIINSGI